eukprot:3926235-Amphidinium_carterae.1
MIARVASIPPPLSKQWLIWLQLKQPLPQSGGARNNDCTECATQYSALSREHLITTHASLGHFRKE